MRIAKEITKDQMALWFIQKTVKVVAFKWGNWWRKKGGELALNKEESRIIECIYFLVGLNFILGQTARNLEIIV